MIGLAILAGTTLAHLWGAHKASEAAKKAAATQSTSANTAMDLNRMLFGQQQQAFAPYQAAGQGAATNLGALLTGARPPQMPASVQKVVGPQQPMPANLLTGTPQPPPLPAQSQTVRMRAPNGSERDIPIAEMQHWMSKGAMRVA